MSLQYCGLDIHLDLTLHCDGEEDDEVDDEDGPEDRDVEGFKECTHGRNDDRLCCTVPVNQHQHNGDTLHDANSHHHSQFMNVGKSIMYHFLHRY